MQHGDPMAHAYASMLKGMLGHNEKWMNIIGIGNFSMLALHSFGSKELSKGKAHENFL
jgi:hypothetical protein